MTKTQFIKENKNEIDIHILRVLGDWKQGTYESQSGMRLNNAERSLWIDNDESLYRWFQMYRRV